MARVDRTRRAARWQPRRSEPGRRWPRSPSCSATWTRRLRRSTCPPTAPRWRRCRSRGRRCGEERSDLAQQRRGLPGYAPLLRFPPLGLRRPARGFRHLLAADGARHGDRRVGAGVGGRGAHDPAAPRAAPQHRPRIRHLPAHARSRCEVPARGLLPVGRRRVPPHIYSPHEIDQSCARARPASCGPRRNDQHRVRPARRGRHALRRSGAPRSRRRRPRPGRRRIVATKFDKSRELALHPRRSRPSATTRPAGSPLATLANRRVLRFEHRPAAEPEQPRADLRRARSPNRS